MSQTVNPPSGDLDFLMASWSVPHRQLKERLAGTRREEFPATTYPENEKRNG